MKIRLFAVVGSTLAVVLWAGLAFAEYHSAVPSESSLSKWLKAMNVHGAWELGYTGNGVVVGVLDDSMSTQHSDYKTSVLEEYCRWARYNGTLDASHYSNRPSGTNLHHGTAVASCIGGYNIGNKIVGTAYNASIIGVGAEDLTDAALLSAMDYLTSDTAAPGAAGLHVSVVNNSYGVPTGFIKDDNQQVQMLSLIQDVSDDTIFVFSAGNERQGKGNTYWNCKDANKKLLQTSPNTLTIAALNASCDEYATFSCYGANVIASAPGTSINASYVDYPSGEYYVIINGTSFSAPLTSGAIALAVEAAQEANGVTLDTYTVKQLLADTCRKIDLDAADDESKWTTNSAGYSFSNSYGFGIIDTEALVRAALEITEIPETTMMTAYNGDLAEGTIDPVYDKNVNYYILAKYLQDSNGNLVYQWDYDSGQYVEVESFGDDLVVANSSSVAETKGVLTASEDGYQVSDIDLTNLPIASEITTLADENSVFVADDGTHAGKLAGYSCQIFDEAAFTDQGLVAMPLQDVSVSLAFQAVYTGDVRIELAHTVDSNQDGIYDASDFTTTSVLCFEDEDFTQDARYIIYGTEKYNNVTYNVAYRIAESAININDLTDMTKYIAWTFTSNAFWGEDPYGKWEVFVYDMHDNGSVFSDGVNIQLVDYDYGSLETSGLSTFENQSLGVMADPDVLIPITFQIQRNAVDPDVPEVPEPSSVVLLALGGLLLFCVKRRRVA